MMAISSSQDYQMPSKANSSFSEQYFCQPPKVPSNNVLIRFCEKKRVDFLLFFIAFLPSKELGEKS